jgi:hypothetical protein
MIEDLYFIKLCPIKMINKHLIIKFTTIFKTQGELLLNNKICKIFKTLRDNLM